MVSLWASLYNDFYGVFASFGGEVGRRQRRSTKGQKLKFSHEREKE